MKPTARRTNHHRHSAQRRFWGEQPSVLDCDFSAPQGARQTTDAYLLALAAHHGGTLLTLDKRLVAAFSDTPVESVAA